MVTTQLMGRGTNLSINILVLLYLILLSIFQIDPHHDGYILGSAAAVASGLLVHAEAFSQYGPITPLLAGLYIKFFGVSVFSTRILAAIIIFITYILIDKTLKILILRNANTKLFAIAWVVLNHVVSTTFNGSLFLWPSVISTFFIVLAVFLICHSHNSTYSSHLQVSAGFVICVAAFTRIQSVMIILALVIFIMLRRKFRLEITRILAGSILGFSLILIGLSLNGILDDFLFQVIMRPLQVYPNIGIQNNYNLFQFSLFLSLPIFMVVFYLLTQRVMGRIQKEVKFLFVLLFGMTVFLLSWVSGELLLSNENTYFRLLIGDQLNRILLWPMYFSFAVSIFMGLLLLVPSAVSKRKVTELNFAQIFAILAGASTTVQIYPLADVGHLWWIMPPLIAPTLILLSMLKVNWNVVQTCIVVLLIASLPANIGFFSKDWKANSYRPLEGTFSYASVARGMEIYQPLTTHLKNKKALFICNDGVHSVASGKYASIDKWFVYWGFDSGSIESQVRLARAADIVICDKERNFSDAIASKFGKKIVFFEENRQGDTYRSLAILENKEKD